MNTDERDGAAAESQLRELLARQFAEELGRAETDYRTLRAPERAAVERLQPRRRMKLRLAVEGLAVVVLLVVGLVVYGQARTPATPAGPTASASFVRGSDGIPTQIDGQRVYRIGDQSEWQNLSGSFLLGGYLFRELANCPAQPAQPSPEADLIPPCGGLGLGSAAHSDATSGGLKVANTGSVALEAWIGGAVYGPAIVVRVHTHDAEAAQCGSAGLADCQAAIVVEAVVWPVVPTEIGGERVYRASDQAVFPKSGSFLLGGPFAMPDVRHSCVARAMSTAQQQLIPYCYILSIDGLGLARMSTIDLTKDELVVARVHINDPLAAECPADIRANCQAAVVVEAVVWRAPAS